MRWPLYFVSNKIKNSLHRVSLMPLDGCRRFGAIEFERHDNHEKTIQLYPGTVRVREAFVLRSIEVYPWFNDLVTACFQKIYSESLLGFRFFFEAACSDAVVKI